MWISERTGDGNVTVERYLAELQQQEEEERSRCELFRAVRNNIVANVCGVV